MATKVERLCIQCSGPMPITARSHAETCSPRCRKARSRAQQLPAELTSRDRWVRYSAKKMPLTVTGRAASSTDPSTWSSYREARASTVGAGTGFVLAAGDGLVCIDLDHALDASGRPEAWAQRILDRLPATYIEVSMSGRGLHVFGLAPAGPGRKIRRGQAAVEVYTQGRYIAVTGNRFAGAPARLADLAGVIGELEGGL